MDRAEGEGEEEEEEEEEQEEDENREDAVEGEEAEEMDGVEEPAEAEWRPESEAMFQDIRGLQVTLNLQYNWSVDEAAFAAHRTTLFKHYASCHEICLLRRLVLAPFSLREVLLEFVDAQVWAVPNPEPENGDGDDDCEGRLAYVHDVVKGGLLSDDRVWYLEVVFLLLVTFPSLCRFFERHSNPLTMRAVLAHLRLAFHVHATSCLDTSNAEKAVEDLVADVDSMAMLGMTTHAQYLPFIHGAADASETRLQNSNPLRITDSDLPACYILAHVTETCGFYASPFDPYDDEGRERLRASVGLPEGTVLAQANIGASSPDIPPGASEDDIAGYRVAALSQFLPENVFYAPVEAAQCMTPWHVAHFYRTFLANGFHQVHKDGAKRAMKSVRLHLQRKAAKKKAAQNEDDEDEDYDDY